MSANTPERLRDELVHSTIAARENQDMDTCLRLFSLIQGCAEQDIASFKEEARDAAAEGAYRVDCDSRGHPIEAELIEGNAKMVQAHFEVREGLTTKLMLATAGGDLDESVLLAQGYILSLDWSRATNT